MTIATSKLNIALEMFVRTADENYITARWCAANQLFGDFLWLSLHAMEKYLKAVLLMNGRTTKKLNHNVVALYDNVKDIAGTLLPDQLRNPAELSIAHWREMPPEHYMDKLNRVGNAENRYATYGFNTDSQDLHMLDLMVFGVRRLACELDARVFLRREAGVPTLTNRDVLTGNQKYYGRLFMPLDILIDQPQHSSRRRAALNLNFSFAPIDYIHEPMHRHSASRNPVIVRRIIRPLQSHDFRTAVDALEVAKWFLDNVQLTGNVAEQIKGAMQNAQRVHLAGPWQP